MIYIFIISFVVTLICLFLYQKFCSKFKLVDLPNKLNVHKGEIPTSAGIIFCIIFLIFIIIFTKFNTIFINKISDPKNFTIFLISLIALVLISFYDDFKKIHPVTRLFFQLTIIFFCTSLFDTSKLQFPLKLIFFFMIYFWVYTLNVINFTDGVDGFLATNAITFFLSVCIFYNYNLDTNFNFLLSLIILSIMLAYLIFNRPKATLFMGDSGSIFLGYLMGYISIQFIINERIDIVISLLSYTYLDCTFTIIKKILSKQAPWARLFDYFFLIPVKNNFSHAKVFYANLIYNFIIFAIVLLQIFLNIKLLCLVSVFASICLIFYFKSFDNSLYRS